MKLTRRDRRALVILSFVGVVVGCRWMLVSSNPKPKGEVRTAAAEGPLTILANRRKAAAAVPQKEKVLRGLIALLAVLESGLIRGDTAAQAQAELLQTLKKVTSQQKPPLEVERIEFSPPQEVGEAYAEVSVSITIQCTIDELLNVVTDLTAESEMIATDEISLIAVDQNLKTLKARLTVKGLVHHILITKPGSPQT
jgi:hypothetical protein